MSDTPVILNRLSEHFDDIKNFIELYEVSFLAEDEATRCVLQKVNYKCDVAIDEITNWIIRYTKRPSKRNRSCK
jgi:hypothetical protein